MPSSQQIQLGQLQQGQSFYTRKTLASALVKWSHCDYEEDLVDDRLGMVLH
jgi:hypothetical protein